MNFYAVGQEQEGGDQHNEATPGKEDQSGFDKYMAAASVDHLPQCRQPRIESQAEKIQARFKQYDPGDTQHGLGQQQGKYQGPHVTGGDA